MRRRKRGEVWLAVLERVVSPPPPNPLPRGERESFCIAHFFSLPQANVGLRQRREMATNISLSPRGRGWGEGATD